MSKLNEVDGTKLVMYMCWIPPVSAPLFSLHAQLADSNVQINEVGDTKLAITTVR